MVLLCKVPSHHGMKAAARESPTPLTSTLAGQSLFSQETFLLYDLRKESWESFKFQELRKTCRFPLPMS